MLHLFNSCYIVPDVLFDPNTNYIVVGKNSSVYGNNVENSFYHSNITKGSCLAKFKTAEDFINAGDLVLAACSSKERLVVYVDEESFTKLYASYLKTQCKTLTKEFYVECCKLMAIKLSYTQKIAKHENAKTILQSFIDEFNNVSDIPKVRQLSLLDNWIRINAGIEWQIAAGNYTNVSTMVNRYVFSFVGEARVNFLSRKEPSGWVVDENNFNFNTVQSFEELYFNIRKEVVLLTDSLILEFYNTQDISSFVKNKKFLLLLDNRKVDIWLLRLLLEKQEQEIKNLGILS